MKKAALAVYPALAAAALVAAAAGGLAPSRDGAVLALARLCGVLGSLGVMGQLLAMSRAPWLEPLTGPALPVKWHHRAGLLIPTLLLAHPALAAWHHSRLSGVPYFEQYASMLRWEDMPAAAAGLALTIAAVLLSLPPLRRLLSYGAWYKTHLAVYAGLALAVGHQFEHGADLAGGRTFFAFAWYGLLVFAAANALWCRLLKPRLAKPV